MEVSQYSLNFGCIVLKRRGLKEIKSDMSEIVLIIGLIFFQISDLKLVASESKILDIRDRLGIHFRNRLHFARQSNESTLTGIQTACQSQFLTSLEHH